MVEMAIDIDLSVGGTLSPINVQDADTLYYRFESTGTLAPSSAVLTPILMVSSLDPGLSTTALTIDGTKGSVDVSDDAFIKLAVTTAEAGRQGNLHIYTRKTTL